MLSILKYPFVCSLKISIINSGMHIAPRTPREEYRKDFLLVFTSRDNRSLSLVIDKLSWFIFFYFCSLENSAVITVFLLRIALNKISTSTWLYSLLIFSVIDKYPPAILSKYNTSFGSESD
jgi:hypothetical protein